jgi:uncharacterized membrane protein (Fun14 family)
MVAVVVTLFGFRSWIPDVRSDPQPDDHVFGMTNAPVVAPADAPAESPASESGGNQPLPGYAKLSASYVVGCCIGWFFRRLTRLILVVCGLVIALLGFGRLVGLDTSSAKGQVGQGRDWAQHQLVTAKESLERVLPSAAGGGVGMFMGFRRRRRVAAAESGI